MTRNIDIGDVISKVFRTYSTYAGVLLPVAAVLFLIEALFQILALQSWVLGLVASVVAVVLSTLYTGMVVELVGDVRDGRLDQSIGDLLNSAAPAILPLIGVSILAGIGITIGFILLIIPGLFLITIWAVVAPVVVLERSGVFAAFGRSRRLVKGNGWQVFGVIVLFLLIYFVISVILGAIGSGLGDVGEVILVYVGRVITAPLVALGAAVLYFELRAAQGEAGPGGPEAGIAGLPSDGPGGSSGFAPPQAPPPPPPPPDGPDTNSRESELMGRRRWTGYASPRVRADGPMRTPRVERWTARSPVASWRYGPPPAAPRSHCPGGR
ncbi:MAG: hypothetical protein R2736_03530 [Solirubrobacterales bacterium]